MQRRPLPTSSLKTHGVSTGASFRKLLLEAYPNIGASASEVEARRVETGQGGHDRDRAHEPTFVNPVIW